MTTLQENKFSEKNYKITLKSNSQDIQANNVKVGITLQTDIFRPNKLTEFL